MSMVVFSRKGMGSRNGGRLLARLGTLSVVPFRAWFRGGASWAGHTRACIIGFLSGRPRLFIPQDPVSESPSGFTVLAHGAGPTVSYYLENRLDALIRQRPGLELDMVDTAVRSPYHFYESALRRLMEHRRVIIVRHTSPAWLGVVRRYRNVICGVVFFLDDDLPGAALDPFLPQRYALRTTFRFLRIRKILAELCDRVWVSTPALAARYPEARATVLPPLPLKDDHAKLPAKSCSQRLDRALDQVFGLAIDGEFETCAENESQSGEVSDVNRYTVINDMEHENAALSPGRGGMYTIFYHGTSSHIRELAFVADVARLVQARRQDTLFEVIGCKRALEVFRGIPRVRKLYPMNWPDYLAHCRAASYHVGLAPLLKRAGLYDIVHDFNSFRAATKIFDIARCGAVGLCSDREPYSAWIGGESKFGRLELLMSDSVEAWADAVDKILAHADILSDVKQQVSTIFLDKNVDITSSREDLVP